MHGSSFFVTIKIYSTFQQYSRPERNATGKINRPNFTVQSEKKARKVGRG